MKCCGTAHQQHMRLGYVVLLLGAIGLGVVFLYFSKELLSPWTEFGLLDCSGEEKAVCLGVQAIYRESFSLVLFFLLAILFSLPGSKFSAIFNRISYLEGCWMLKGLLLAGLFIGCFYIPNGFFVWTIQDVYRDVAQFVSLVFLVLQIAVMIDFAYSWSESWIAQYERSGESGYWSFCLFFFSGLMWIIALVTIILSYYWFTKDSGCSLNVFLITSTLALGIAFTALSMTNWVEYGSLLTSSLVNLYITYLCWDALTSDSSSCNSWKGQTGTGMSILFGSLVLLVVLLYLSFSKRERKQGGEAPIRGVAEPMLAEDGTGQEELPYNEESDGRRMIYFLMMMVLTSFYLAMLLSDWGAPSVYGADYQG